MRVVVVGAGVVGLLAAHELAHRGHDVGIVTAEDPLATTSATAGASFKPRAVAADRRTVALLAASREVLAGWDRSGFAPALGITRHRHVLATAGERLDFPWADHMDDVRRRSRDAGDDVVAGLRTELSFTTWYFDVSRVLPALVTHVTGDHGVEVAHQRLEHLEEVAEDAAAIVHATGVGARALAGDDRIEPIAGQVVRVRRRGRDGPWAPGGAAGSVSADGTYAYPRPDGWLLGGTAERGAWDREPDPAVTEAILAGARRLVPGLPEAGDPGVEAVVGLRPHRRGGIRLERDREIASVPVVHAYGHGGAGWTLAPGTARLVADLVDRVAPDQVAPDA